MRQPLLRAVMWLSQRFRQPSFVVASWGAEELLRQLAFARLSDEDFHAQWKQCAEQERLAAMSHDERVAHQLAMLGFDVSQLKRKG